MIKISKLIINKSILQREGTGNKYLVIEIGSEKNWVMLQAPDNTTEDFTEEELNTFFNPYGQYKDTPAKTQKLTLTYTVDKGKNIDMEFEKVVDMMTFAASLIGKHKEEGQYIEIKAFRGPMALMKTLIVALTEDVD